MDHLNKFLDPGLIHQARFVQTATAALRRGLPSAAAQHCWVGRIRDNALVVITDSSTWVVSIRYQQHELLKQLNAEFCAELQQPLTRLKIKVRASPTATQKPLSRPRISPDSSRHLLSAAAGIGDPDLRAALERLARRASGPASGSS